MDEKSGGNPPRGGRHQGIFCKTQIEGRSENEIVNFYQSKGETEIDSETRDKEWACYFLISRLLTACGMINEKNVVAMRDTGFTGCVIRRSLVSKDQLLGKESDLTLIYETTQRYPLALIDIDCPFFTGQTEALCMKDTLYYLVTGNIDGPKLPDMSHFVQQFKLGHKLSNVRICIGNLRFLIGLKKAQATDANLENIRCRVKSGSVTVSLLIVNTCCTESLLREIRLHCNLLY